MDYVWFVLPILTLIGGFIFGRVLSLKDFMKLRDEFERLHREYSRLTDRDSRGRFTKRKD